MKCGSWTLQVPLPLQHPLPPPGRGVRRPRRREHGPHGVDGRRGGPEHHLPVQVGRGRRVQVARLQCRQVGGHTRGHLPEGTRQVRRLRGLQQEDSAVEVRGELLGFSSPVISLMYSYF